MDGERELDITTLNRDEMIELLKSLMEQISVDEESYRNFRDITNAKISLMEDKIHALEELVLQHNAVATQSPVDENEQSHDPRVPLIRPPQELLTVPFHH